MQFIRFYIILKNCGITVPRWYKRGKINNHSSNTSEKWDRFESGEIVIHIVSIVLTEILLNRTYDEMEFPFIHFILIPSELVYSEGGIGSQGRKKTYIHQN